ncbi:MAG TPA: hypothetical protein VGW38_29565 [Chloroflexota bacterium]|nr:hypothetical protein [Chloroflexota bacterium]
MSETTVVPVEVDEDDDGEERHCWRCHGDGWGMVGVDWDCDDGVNGPYDGEIEECTRCGGSGLEKDAWYW